MQDRSTNAQQTHSSFTNALAAEIRAEMARQNRTNIDLAAALYVHRVTASKIVNGRRPLNLEEVHTVAIWLGLNPRDLLDRAAGIAA